MQAVAEPKTERPVELPSSAQCDEDLVHELGTRLGTLWHYGECIANAEGEPELERVWRDLENHELARIRELKQIIIRRIEKGEFLEGL